MFVPWNDVQYPCTLGGGVRRSMVTVTFDPSSLCPDLLLLALEKKDYFLCQLCLQLFRDIPEAVTCACLKAFLR